MPAHEFIRQQNELIQQLQTAITEYEQTTVEVEVSLAHTMASAKQQFDKKLADLAKPVEEIRELCSIIEQRLSWSRQSVMTSLYSFPNITEIDADRQMALYLSTAQEKSAKLKKYGHAKKSYYFIFGTAFFILALILCVIDSLEISQFLVKIDYYMFNRDDILHPFFITFSIIFNSASLIFSSVYIIQSYKHNQKERNAITFAPVLLAVMLFIAQLFSFASLAGQNFYMCIVVIETLLTLVILIRMNSRRNEHKRYFATLVHTLNLAENLYQQQLSKVNADYNHWLGSIRQNHQERHQKVEHVLSDRFASLSGAITNYNQENRVFGAAWGDPQWRRWQSTSSPPTIPAVRLGTLRVRYKEYRVPPMPMFISFPGGQNLLLKASSAVQKETTEMVQSLLLRLFATYPPGTIRCTFIDPVSFGHNVAPFMQLKNFDESLVNSQVWTEAGDVERQLADLSGYIAQINQIQMGGTIEEYNARHRNAPLPYRFLVVFGFPYKFTYDNALSLLAIARNGPRCGVYTLVVYEREQPHPQGFTLADFERVSIVIAWEDDQVVWDGVKLTRQTPIIANNPVVENG